MKNLITVFLLFIGLVSYGQTLTLTSPSGMIEPYEVSSGTQITVNWDYSSTEPTYMFSYDQDPGSNLDNTYQFSPNPSWTQNSGWTDNGDNTWNWSMTVTEEVWIFGAFSVFFGNSHSNVIHISIASGVTITDVDGLICSGNDTETLSVQGAFTNFQWYMDGVILDGETSSTYDATAAGQYYCLVDELQSNTLTISEIVIDYTGALNVDGTELTLSAEAGFDAYQWYSGSDTTSMSEIVGATNQEYIATLTSSLVYYNVVGTLGTCDASSPNKSANLEMFVPAIVLLNADTNGFGNVCEGSVITVSIPDTVTNFTWFKNGNSTYYSTNFIDITSVWATGDYYVETTTLDWPEISIQSNTVSTSYYELMDPVLFGVDNSSYHCVGEVITLDLTDEGYDYSWYQHTAYTYNDTDLITVINNSYTFTFDSLTRITVVGTFQGCEAQTTISLNDYADQNMYISISNYNQQYLCTDSTAHIGLNYSTDNYVDFQWYQQVGGDWTEIVGDTTNLYDATEPGFYKVSATSAFCPTAFIESSVYEVKDYLDRNLNMWADQTEMCLGDTASLSFGSYSWTNIQWLKGDIIMGSQGWEMIYVPVSGAGSEGSADVMEFNHFIVKAKHNSCPNGLKSTSDPVIIKPSVNPEVIVDMEVYSYRMALWDSAIFYLDCIGNDVSLYIQGDYDSYQWYDTYYAGLDDYIIGDSIVGANADSINVEINVQWITAEVELNGCIGYTDPIMLDGWAFLDPVVQSYNNNELCEEGDSALINLGFQGTWIEYYWTLDGEIIPNSNNDSIWVNEPGQYVIWAYPEACPTALFTSGIGPTFEYLTAEIFEAEDEFGDPFFWAYPWQGFYEFQWYIDDVPYDNPSSNPAILWQDGLPEGIITVEITNPEPCTAISEGVDWNPNAVGIDENNEISLSIYPNPSNGLITIEGLDPFNTSSVLLYNTQGKVVRTIDVYSEYQKVDITDLPKGMYLLRIQDNSGAMSTYTVNKL